METNMTEPQTYSKYTHNGFKMHLCECEDDECTFFSCNITGEPSKCECVGCDGKIIYHKSEGVTGLHRCYTCDFTYQD